LDAHVTVKSDPLPTILNGVPLRLRTINVTLDRDRFKGGGRRPAAAATAGDGQRAEGNHHAPARKVIGLPGIMLGPLPVTKAT
jgi:hypothetical protein